MFPATWRDTAACSRRWTATLPTRGMAAFCLVPGSLRLSLTRKIRKSKDRTSPRWRRYSMEKYPVCSSVGGSWYACRSTCPHLDEMTEQVTIKRELLCLGGVDHPVALHTYSSRFSWSDFRLQKGAHTQPGFATDGRRSEPQTQKKNAERAMPIRLLERAATKPQSLRFFPPVSAANRLAGQEFVAWMVAAVHRSNLAYYQGTSTYVYRVDRAVVLFWRPFAEMLEQLTLQLRDLTRRNGSVC